MMAVIRERRSFFRKSETMKRLITLGLVAAAGLPAGSAQAGSRGDLVAQGFHIEAVIRCGIEGGCEVYLRRGRSLFICRTQMTEDRQVLDLGCRELNPDQDAEN